jgi:predicted amidohydrolase YtcJ
MHCLLSAVLCLQGSPELPARDLLVHNALVWTADAETPAASSFGVRDGVIVAVGEREQVETQLRAGFEALDLGGRRVTPGLVDAHVHLVNAAGSLAALDVRGATSRENLLQRVADHARDLEPNDWVVGRGWSAEGWPLAEAPTADELELASGGRAVVLTRMDGHSLIASRSALAAAGIDADGPADPPGGRIGRGDDGQPTGAVFEEAMGLLTSLIPDPETDFEVFLRRAIDQLHGWGVTSVGAIEPLFGFTEYLIPLDAAGQLDLHVYGVVTEDGLFVPQWAERIDWVATHRRPTDHVRMLGFKGYMDGSLGSKTAWMHAAFSDDPGNTGLPASLAGNGGLRRIIEIAAQRGVQPVVHAIGDRANSTLLDWYAALPAARRGTLRPRIEHAQHLRPKDVGRFAELGVIASMQPLHKADDGRYAERRLGKQRIQSSYAFRSLLDSGARLAFGSDWPVVSANPLLGIHAAVSARTLDGKTFLPEQSLTLEEALFAYTRDAAYALFAENEVGRIAPGLAADFVVFGADPFELEPRALHERAASLVSATYVAGRQVHPRPPREAASPASESKSKSKNEDEREGEDEGENEEDEEDEAQPAPTGG